MSNQHFLETVKQYIESNQKHLKAEHKEHLMARGMTEAQIDQLKIGFHPIDGFDGPDSDALIKAGMYFEAGGKIYSNFGGSIIIPLHLNNNIVSVMAYNPGYTENPRYAFPKGHHKPIAGNIGKETVVVAGFFDMITAQNAGYSCITTLGPLISKHQQDIIKDFKCRRYYLIPDGEPEAQKKAFSSWGKAFKPGIKVKIEAGDDDLNSIYMATPDGFTEKLDELIDQACESVSGGSDKPSLTEVYETVMAETKSLCVSLENESFVIYEANKVLNIPKVKSVAFKLFIRNLIFDQLKFIISSEMLNQVIEQIEATAHRNPKTEVFNRVAVVNGKYYYDLTRADGHIIEIDENGYRVIENPSIFFRREDHMAPQVMAEKGNMDLLFDIIKLTAESQRLLLKVTLVYCIIHGMPKPIIYAQGAKGASKTESSKMIKMLIDPSVVESLAQPTTQEALELQMVRHYTPCYDNVNYMSDMFIRTLCTTATGQASEKRSLFTNSETTIYRFTHPVIVNSINRLDTSRPDFQDRMVLITFDRIPEELRREQSEVRAHFEAIRGQVFTGMIETLSKAISIKKTLRLKNLPRMADFAAWGEAISMAMGNEEGAFMKAYKENMITANSEVISDNPVANVITLFMADKPQWNGTMTKLYEDLEPIALDNHIDIKGKQWPKSPAKLSQRINEIRSNLQDVGIEVANTHVEGAKAARRPLAIFNKQLNNGTTNDAEREGVI